MNNVKQSPTKDFSEKAGHSEDCRRERNGAAESGLRTDEAYAVNQPFRGKQFAANKKLSESDRERLEKHIPADEDLKFIVYGDLTIKSRYGGTFLAVTDKRIYGFDDTFENGVRIHTYDRVKRAFVKRYYGNAVLIFSMDSGGGEFVDFSKEHVNFLRFSYKVASLYDSAAFFIQNIAQGNSIHDEMRIMDASFEKQFCVCPQCGRNLIRPGAPCMNCQSKDKIVKKADRLCAAL